MTVAKDLGEYAYNLRYEDLPEKAVHETKRRIIDTLGCAIGAYNEEPVRMVRQLASSVTGNCTIIGTNQKTTPEMSAFANTTMSRYLDFMDTYFYNGEIVHPSDNIASILAVAEDERIGGSDIILSTILAYEVCSRFVDFANIRKRGWDHAIWITISSALAASKLMRLAPEKIQQAVAIAVSSNIPLRQIRVGGLSMWKGLAVAYAAKAGVFSAQLARHGITGPDEVFEGKMGFFNQVAGRRDFSVKNFGDGYKIHEAHIKKYPAEINSQSGIEAALQLRGKISNLEEIKKINILTFTTGYEIIADKAKWHPTNRETADHSLPYIVCAALMDGEITERQFTMSRINDKKLRELMDKTDVKPSKECDKDYYPGTPTIVEIVTNSGKFSSKVIHPRGFYKNPMSDSEIEDKFKNLAGKYIPKKQAEDALGIIWDLEKQKDMKKLYASLFVK